MNEWNNNIKCHLKLIVYIISSISIIPMETSAIVWLLANGLVWAHLEFQPSHLPWSNLNFAPPPMIASWANLHVARKGKPFSCVVLMILTTMSQITPINCKIHTIKTVHQKIHRKILILNEMCSISMRNHKSKKKEQQKCI